MNCALIINTGSTSTKLSIFRIDSNEIAKRNILYNKVDFIGCSKIAEQYQIRTNGVMDFIRETGIPLTDIEFIAARGGLIKPVHGGVWEVNKKMVEDLQKAERGEHASNLSAIIAYNIASKLNVKAYIANPVVVDELEDIARISGIPQIERVSIFHALNQKSVALKAAYELGGHYSEFNFIVAHLGGGITVGAHKKGYVIDTTNGLYGEGPFSPERSGALPAEDLIKLCFSGQYSMTELIDLVHGKGGMYAYLGTSDAAVTEKMEIEGNHYAKLIREAMAYQISKEICSMAAPLNGFIDAVIITGGLAYDKKILQNIIERVKFLGKIIVYPGEDEMMALYTFVLAARKGDEPVNTYI